MEFEPRETDAVEPERAFELLGHEIRIGIIRELYEAGGPDGPGRLAYSELQDRVEIRDSGKFGYHLGKLRGRFVTKEGEVYGLTFAGAEAYRAVASGIYDGAARLEPTPLDADCPGCGSHLELSYANDQFSVACPDCPTRVLDLAFPYPATEDYDPDALLEAISVRTHQELVSVSRRICPDCGGRLEGEIVRVADLPMELGPEREVYGRLQCSTCNGMQFPAVAAFVLYEPYTVAAYEQAGVDVFERPVWDQPVYASDRHLTVVEDEPLRVEVDLPVTDGGPDFAVAGDLSVVRLADESG